MEYQLGNRSEDNVLRYLAQEGDLDNLIKESNGDTTQLEKLDELNKNCLHYSIQKGHLSIVKYLVECGLSTEVSDINGNTPILYAAHFGFLDILKYLAENNAATEKRNADQNSIVHEATIGNHIESLKWIISNNIGFNIGSLDDFNDEGSTPLIIASANGYIEIVKWIVDILSLDIKNLELKKALMQSTCNGHFELVKFFIEEIGISPKENYNNNMNLLIAAAGSKDLNLLKYLAESKKISLHEHAGDEKWNALMMASYHGRIENAKYLIQKGIPLEYKNSVGISYLGVAASGNQISFVKWLLENYGKYFHEYDRSIALYLSVYGGNLELSQYLYENDASLSIKGENGNSPLLVAASNGFLALFSWIIENVELFDDSNDDGDNILHLATKSGNLELVQFIVEKLKFSLEKTNSMGQTALHCSVYPDVYPPILKYLVRKGAKQNAKDNDGKTAKNYMEEMDQEDNYEYYLLCG